MDIGEVKASLRFAQNADVGEAFKQLFKEAVEVIESLERRRDSLLGLAQYGSDALREACDRIDELEKYPQNRYMVFAGIAFDNDTPRDSCIGIFQTVNEARNAAKLSVEDGGDLEWTNILDLKVGEFLD